MDKKIIKLSLTETKAVVGGIINVTATATRAPAPPVSQPVRPVTLTARW